MDILSPNKAAMVPTNAVSEVKINLVAEDDFVHESGIHFLLFYNLICELTSLDMVC